ncbi:MAG: hypothetical protein II838_13540 [Lachnospiraceae bacterium]|nr:hypothetical protein [Lachnospiraceae bacterium]
MKYLYVLVSNLADYYSEQAFLSIYSLKLKTPNAFISLLVDNQTAEYLKTEFQELIKSVDEFKEVELDSKYTNKEKSRILKTTMRQHIEGDFLFIDCDTVICEDLSEIEKCEFDIGCVLDTHVPMSRHSFHDWIIRNYKKCGFEESLSSDFHFNSGVIYCKDNSKVKHFFDDWYTLWKTSYEKGIDIDQPAFNQANVINHNIISEISNKWNCQLVHGGFKYILEAKIIHYFASNKYFKSPYILADNAILKEIRLQKAIPNKYADLVSNSRVAIDEQSTLLSSDISREIFDHQPFREIVYIYNKHSFLYKILRVCFFIYGKLHRG